MCVFNEVGLFCVCVCLIQWVKVVLCVCLIQWVCFVWQRDLETKQSQQVVSQLLEEMLGGIRTPVRARSPVDAYITEEEIFHRHNPGVRNDPHTAQTKTHKMFKMNAF